MDHSGAIQIGAERYLLGQLDPQVRNEYEEHYFNCGECAEDVRLTAAFLDNAKPLLRWQEAKSEAAVSSGSRFFGWLWPMPAGAVAFALALLGVVSYQNVVVIPKYREQLAGLQAPVHTPSYFLSISRSDLKEVVASRTDRFVALTLSR